MTNWSEQLFFVSGAPQLRQSFRVKVLDGANELVNRRVYADDSGEAANIVLDELKHEHETRLDIRVT